MAMAEQESGRIRVLTETLGERIPTPFYLSILGLAVLALGFYLNVTGWPEAAGLALAYSVVLMSLGVVVYLIVKIAFLFDTFEG